MGSSNFLARFQRLPVLTIAACLRNTLQSWFLGGGGADKLHLLSLLQNLQATVVSTVALPLRLSLPPTPPYAHTHMHSDNQAKDRRRNGGASQNQPGQSHRGQSTGRRTGLSWARQRPPAAAKPNWAQCSPAPTNRRHPGSGCARYVSAPAGIHYHTTNDHAGDFQT